MPMASDERNRGYRTSSFTMLSKTSSSSSPGNGDYKKTIVIRNVLNWITIRLNETSTSLTSPTSISYMRTPSPHQSTARVYDVSVRTSGAKNSGVPQNVLVRSPNPMPEDQKTKHLWHHQAHQRAMSMRSASQSHYLLCTIQSQRSSHNHLCQAANCPTSDLWRRNKLF